MTATQLDTAPARPQPATAGREFLVQQLPLVLALLALGFASAWWQYGYIPGGARAFPEAGVRVPVWHIVWMGVWTGYTMALVGQAAGIFALPYSASVLQFSNLHVTPTMLVLTFLNPLGALLGFRRSGQWNLDLAVAVCLGGVVGGVIGPFMRTTLLADADTFRCVLGVMLGFFGAQVTYRALRDRRRFGRVVGHDFIAAPDNVAAGPGARKFEIVTLRRSLGAVAVRFGAEQRVLSNGSLFLVGAGVGVISSALGVGGGFLLVPIFAAAYRLPLYVMVAATIPYTIALSSAGILSFAAILPLLGHAAVEPEWSWGFFAAAGGVFGSWWAAKTQLFVPEHLLNLMLGGVTGVIGAVYVVHYLLALHGGG